MRALVTLDLVALALSSSHDVTGLPAFNIWSTEQLSTSPIRPA